MPTSDQDPQIGEVLEVSSQIKGSALRGTLLHKLMEERITGELEEGVDIIRDRARELISQSGEIDQENPAEGISSQELAETVTKTCELEPIQALWQKLVPEYPIHSYRSIEGKVPSIISGIADAVALGNDGKVTHIIDWKSDTRLSQIQTKYYKQQVSAYMEATGAKEGLIVYMTKGTFETVASKM